MPGALISRPNMRVNAPSESAKARMPASLALVSCIKRSSFSGVVTDAMTTCSKPAALMSDILSMNPGKCFSLHTRPQSGSPITILLQPCTSVNQVE